MNTVSCVHINIPLVKDVKVCHSVSNEELWTSKSEQKLIYAFVLQRCKI
jgi:hypothetical protein